MRDMVHVRRARNNQFADEPRLNIGRSQFNLTHNAKRTFDVGYLVPFMVQEVLPGDTYTMSLDGFIRILSPLDAPIMDDIEFETFSFFVPNRLVWSNWQYFMGEHDDAGAQDTTYTTPKIATGGTVDQIDSGYSNGRLMAFMGLPHGLQTGSIDVQVLPFRAYNLIYNEWFRDQNIIDEIAVLKDNGPDGAGNYAVKKSAKKHDYFTSCLPYLQKGDASTVAISGIADVEYDGLTGGNPAVYATTYSTYHELDADAALVDLSVTTGVASDKLHVDLSAGTVDINLLREAVAIQRLLERDARGGTRYVEIIKSHFGVTSPDYRLQRPEYLGGGRGFINISPVANTSDTTNADQGELRGIGTGVIRGHGWAKSFTEHGHIISIIRARGAVTYFQGLDRMWSRDDRYDFYWPALAHLGEQAVLKKELYIQNSSADDETFGYQERWQEYRTKRSTIGGYFDPNVAGNLQFWHLAEDFGSMPGLNQTFIEDNTPMDRVTTADTTDHFVMDLRINLKRAAPIPLHSIPSLVDARF